MPSPGGAPAIGGVGVIELTHGMVLAAGLGLRMRPLTETTAKPLLTAAWPQPAGPRAGPAGGRRRAAGGGQRALACDQVAAAVARRRRAAHRPATRGVLLETGGGVTRALPLLRRRPLRGGEWRQRLARRSHPGAHPHGRRLRPGADGRAAAAGPQRPGGWRGRPRRFPARPARPGRAGRRSGSWRLISSPACRSSRPACSRRAGQGAFSLNRLYDRAIEAGRLFALVHDGVWFHLSTPADLERAEPPCRRGWSARRSEAATTLR